MVKLIMIQALVENIPLFLYPFHLYIMKELLHKQLDPLITLNMLTQTIRIMRYTLSLLTLLIISNQLKSQPISRIDSLINVAEQSGDSVQVKIFGDLCWDLKFSNPQLSVKFGKKAINAAGNANSSMLSAQAHSDLGMVYYLSLIHI